MHLAMATYQILVRREFSVDRATYSTPSSTRIVTITSRRIFPVHTTSIPPLSIQSMNLLIDKIFKIFLLLLRIIILGFINSNVSLAVIVKCY